MKAALMEARERGYIEARARNRQELALAWQWFEECEETQRPFVRVKTEITRGAVTLDMGPSRRWLNAAGIEAVRDAIIATPGGMQATFRYGNFTRVSGLYLADCHSLALALLKIATTEAYLEAESEGASRG